MDASRLRKIIAENEQYNELRAKDAARNAEEASAAAAASLVAREETKVWARTLGKKDFTDEIVQRLTKKVLESAEAGRKFYAHTETLWTLFGFCGCGDYTCGAPPEIPEKWHDHIYSALQTQFPGCHIVFEERNHEETFMPTWTRIKWA